MPQIQITRPYVDSAYHIDGSVGYSSFLFTILIYNAYKQRLYMFVHLYWDHGADICKSVYPGGQFNMIAPLPFKDKQTQKTFN